jgi:hypothetical protein
MADIAGSGYHRKEARDGASVGKEEGGCKQYYQQVTMVQSLSHKFTRDQTTGVWG